MINAVYAYYETGNNARALEYLEKAYALDPKETDVLVGLAVLYHQQNSSGQHDKMLKDITENTSYKPRKKSVERINER